MTKKSGIVVGALAFENNLFDGHTLDEHLSQTKELISKRPKIALVGSSIWEKRKYRTLK